MICFRPGTRARPQPAPLVELVETPGLSLSKPSGRASRDLIETNPSPVQTVGRVGCRPLASISRPIPPLSGAFPPPRLRRGGSHLLMLHNPLSPWPSPLRTTPTGRPTPLRHKERRPVTLQRFGAPCLARRKSALCPPNDSKPFVSWWRNGCATSISKSLAC